MKVKAGRNVWARFDLIGNVIEWRKSNECPGDDWSPHYNAARVRGDTYEYYDGNDEWTRAANAAMASAANSNFRRQQTF